MKKRVPTTEQNHFLEIQALRIRTERGIDLLLKTFEDYEDVTRLLNEMKAAQRKIKAEVQELWEYRQEQVESDD